MIAPAKTHIMVDLETMGSRPGSVIASIGAVVFDPVAGTLGEAFYRTIKLSSCADVGLRFDGDTVGWWLRQGDEARAALFVEPSPLAAVLNEFYAWWRARNGAFFWSHGANFDDPILAEAFRAIGGGPPWKYWDSRCTRTVFDLAGVKPDRAAGVHHTALDDAKAQAAAVNHAYRILGLAAGYPYRTISGSLMDIAQERERHRSEEGWSDKHDDDHGNGEMALAAAAYAVVSGCVPLDTIHAGLAKALWPWDVQWWKPGARRRNLVKAGALCAAEIDRLDRAKAREVSPYAGHDTRFAPGRGAPRS